MSSKATPAKQIAEPEFTKENTKAYESIQPIPVQ